MRGDGETLRESHLETMAAIGRKRDNFQELAAKYGV